jgi:hypothetical protein
MNAFGPFFFLRCAVILLGSIGLVLGAPAVPPPNDNFADAILISGDSATGNNEAATKQTGEPRTVQTLENTRSTLGGHSIWWKWVVPHNAQYTIRTGDKDAVDPSSTFDTQLGIYTGTSLSNLVEVASNEDHPDFFGGLSQVSFRATAGRTYYILIDGKQGELGTAYLYIVRTRFSLTVAIAPENSAQLTIDPPAPAGGYLPGTEITLTLDTTNTFFGWTGINTRSNPLSITIQSNTTLTANFASDGLIFWHHTNGPVAAWYMNGMQPLSAYSLGASGSNWTLRTTGDMDQDGDHDLLFQHADGRIDLWRLEGENVEQTSQMADVGPGWRLAGVGGFNADATPDLLFHHTDGRVVVWLMENLQPTNAVLVTTAQPGWSIRAVQDFNNDQWSDIFFQHSDGRIVLWLMNGTQITTAVRMPVPAAGWNLAAVKDFNNDSLLDLLFESTNRQLAVWQMNGMSRAGGFLLRAGQAFRPGWHVKGAK